MGEGGTERAEAEDAAGAPETGGRDAERADAPEVDWKAKSREWEKRARANQAAAKKLAEIEEAGKTDAEKAQARIAELEAKLAGHEAAEQARQWAAQVSKKTGVPAGLLRGATLAEVEDHAAALKAAGLKDRGGPVVPSEGAGRPRVGTTADAFAALIEDQLKR